MYLNVNNAYGLNFSTIAEGEKNDCVVRALATAAESTYDAAHAFCKVVFKRENRKGVLHGVIASSLKEGSYTIGDTEALVRPLGQSHIKNRYKVNGEVIWRKKTLKSFIATHTKGTYLVLVSGHALTVKDGELYDWSNFGYLPTRKVTAAYAIEVVDEKPVEVQLSLF